MLNGVIKRKISLDKIPNYLLKPFWKNELYLETVIYFFGICSFFG